MLSPTKEAQADTGTPRRTILWLAANAFVSSAAMRISDPLLPPISADFGVTIGTASIIATSYAVAYGLLQLVFGPLGDRLGKMRLVLVSTTAASVAVFACGLAPTLGMLAAARLVSGGFAAAIIPLSMAYIGDVVPYRQRQRVLAQLMMGTTSGLIFGQAASGILAEYLDWRAVFFLLAALFLIAAIGLRLEIGRPAPPAPVPPKSVRETARHTFALAGRPIVLAVLFTVFAEGALALGTFAYLGSHLHDRIGLSFDKVGLILALFGLGGITYGVFSGFFVQKLGERGLVGFGGVFVSLGMAASALAQSALPFLFIAPLIGLGFTMFHNTLQTRATQMAPDSRGTAVSLFASCFFLGQTTGVALAGLSYDIWGAVPGFIASALSLPVLAALFARHLAKIG